MSEFYDLLEEYLGDADSIADIRVTARRLWFYDFVDYPTRMWDGGGRLFTSDGNEWIGTMPNANTNFHKSPRLQDGRDGTSATYSFSMAIFDLPGEPAGELYQQLKAEQWRAYGRTLTCYLAIFKENEGLRPTTPIVFFKELTMQTPRFNEKLDTDANGVLTKHYLVTIPCKDGNSGRSNIPGGTYADAIQKQRARELGVSLDRGAEFLAKLSNRTYQIP